MCKRRCTAETAAKVGLLAHSETRMRQLLRRRQAGDRINLSKGLTDAFKLAAFVSDADAECYELVLPEGHILPKAARGNLAPA